MRVWIDRMVRWLLGLSLAVAGFLKLAPPWRFVESLANFRILPAQANQILGVLLPSWELTVGIMLLVGVWRRSAAMLALVLYSSFTGSIGQALVRGLDVRCGCFGDLSRTPPGWESLLLDVVGLLASAVVLHRESSFLLRADGGTAPATGPENV